MTMQQMVGSSRVCRLGAWFLAVFMVMSLAACGGGGGGGGGSTAPVSAAGAGSVSGLAATGAAINGRIYLKDAAGHQSFVDTTDGTYSFPLAGLTPPFMLKAQWTVGATSQTLYSFATGSGHANITPLTHMLVAAAAGTDSLDAIFTAASPTAFGNIANALPLATLQLQQSLAPLLSQYGVGSADPITVVFAADHTGMDALLDNITVSYQAGTVTVASKTGDQTLLQAPVNNLTHAVSMASWASSDAGVANDPDVAVDATGKGLVVWSEQMGAHYFIRARFLDGLATAVTLSNAGDAALPRVAVDANGNALVVWAQYVGARNEIWASRYVSSSATWSTPVIISSASAVSSAYVPDIAMDAAGNALVTWHQGDGRTNHFDAWMARFAATSNSWAAPIMLSDGVNSAYDVRVAVNGAGAGLLAWEQEQGDGTTVSNGPKDIRARPATTAGVLGTSSMLNAVPGNVDAVYGQIAVAANSAGGGAVLWVQSSGPLPFVIHAAMYASSAWQSSAVITQNVLDSSYGPRIAFDATGNAIAVWQQQTGSSAFGGSNRYVAGVGWGTSGQFVDDAQGDTYDPHLAVDAAGNATVVWYRWGNTGIDVMLNRYLPASGWGSAQVLAPTATVGGLSYPVPAVAANASGQTIAVWGTDSY